MRTFLLKKDIIRVMGIVEKEEREKRTERLKNYSWEIPKPGKGTGYTSNYLTTKKIFSMMHNIKIAKSQWQRKNCNGLQRKTGW